jgi:HicB family
MKSKQSTLIIRLPNELKHKVELMAEEQGVSLNQFALYAFTKEVIQTETQSYFQGIWKSKTKKEILGNFDAVVKKIGKGKVPEWDKL